MVPIVVLIDVRVSLIDKSLSLIGNIGNIVSLRDERVIRWR